MSDSVKIPSQEPIFEESAEAAPSAPEQEYLFRGIWDTCCFGLFLKWIGFVIIWHIALFYGFREFMIAFTVITIGYTTLICSLAEMVSVIAFPGGYYGYARCAVHPFFGYLVGCSGIIENIIIVASCSSAISGLITLLFNTSVELEPIWWVAIHFLAIVAHIQKRTVYWYMMLTMSTICLGICLVYFLGSIPRENFHKNVFIATTPIDPTRALEVLFLPALLYSGTDLMVLTSYEVKDSKRVVPKAMVWTFVMLVLLSIATIFSTISQAPGLRSFDLFTTAYGWSFGFAEMFHVKVKYAAAYALLPLLSSMFGYMFVGGRGIRSMAMSGLFPRILASEKTFTQVKAPLPAMCLTSAIALVLQGVGRRYPTSSVSLVLVFYGAFIGYLGMLICYVVFRVKYSNLERTFKSPLGIPGAVIGFGVFITGIISLNRLPDKHISICAYGAWMGLFVLYYVLYGERNQTFAAEEQQEFFKLYLINMNRRRRAGLMRSRILFWRSLFYGHKQRVVPGYDDGTSGSARGGSLTSQKDDHTTLRTASLGEVTPVRHGGTLDDLTPVPRITVPVLYEAEENEDL